MRKILILILGLLAANLNAQELLKEGGFRTSGATSGQTIKWNGSTWVPSDDLGGTSFATVADSTAFRAFSTSTAPEVIIMTDSLRGGVFKRTYTSTVDQYMVFTDALGRKWERVIYENCVYPEWFGAKGDSTTSDNVAFRKSFEFLRGSSINTLRLRDKRYVLTGLVTNTFSTSTNKSIDIIGTSRTIIVNKSIVSPFQFLNAPISLTLSQNQTADKNWIRCSGISTLVPGDIIFIKSSEIAETGWNYPVNDQHVINRIGGDTLFLRNNLNFNYTTGAIVEFVAYKSRSINFSNVQFIEDAACVEGVIYMVGFKSSEFRNISTKYNITSAGIILAPQIRCWKCVDQTFENMAIHNSQYGIDVSSSRNTIVNNIAGSYSWGLVVPASWSDGVFINGLTGNNITLDGHPSFNVSYKNVNVVEAGVSIRSLGVTVENMKLFNKDSSTYGYCIFEMSGLMENPYKYKVPLYPTTLKNVELLSTTKNTTFHTVDQNSTHYNIDGLTANAIFITRKTNLNSVQNVRTGHVRVWKPDTQFRSMILDGSISPTWVTGFLLMDQSNINIDGLKVRNASTKNLFSSADPSKRMYVSNSTIDTILSIGNSGASSNLNSVVLENCILKNFGSTSNNNAQFHNVTYDATVLSSINPEKNNLAFNNFTSNEYQRTGIVIENTQGSGIPQLDLYGGPAAAELALRGGTGVLSLTNLYNDNGRLDLGVTIATVPTQKIRVDYTGNVGIGGVSAPTDALHVGGNVRVTGAIKDASNDAGTSGQVLSSTVTGTDWIAPPSGVIDLTVTGTSSPLTLNSSNGTDVTITAGTNISLAGTTGNITINNTQTEVNGIYTGSGTIPNNTNATATDDFTITTVDATGTQSPKFRIVATGTDPGVQVWKVGNDSLQLSYIGGEATLDAIGTSGDFWINSVGNDLRLGNGSTGVFTHVTKNVLGGYLALPYVQTASSITVNEGTAEVDVIGTSGTITLTFDNTSNLLGSAAKTITVRNRGAFNVTLSRGSQSWQWSDMTGTNTASNQTLAAGETGRMLWVDQGVTDYYVLHKTPNLFTGGSTNLAVTGSSSPLTLTSDTGTDVTFTAGTNVTLAGTSGNITISAAGGGDILNGGNSAGGTVTIGTNDNNVLSLETNNVTRLSIANGTTTGGIITATNVNANTSSPVDALILSTNSTGTGATGFGTGILFKAESNTTNDRDVARIAGFYTDATNATSSTALTIDLKDAGTFAETYRFEPLGNLKVGQVSPTSFGKANITSGVDFTVGNSANLLTLGGSTGLVTVNSSASGSAVKINASGTSSYIEVGGTTASTITSGNKSNMDFAQGFTASSGTGNMNNIILSGTINQSGTASGELAGLHVNHTITAGVNYRGVYIDADGGTNSKGVYQTGSSMTNNFVGKTFFGATTSPTAMLHLGAGTTTLAPLKFTSGTNLTTPEAGAIEWNGTNLFVTQTSGPTRKQIAYTTDITGGSTNLAITGTSSPLTLTSDTGTDVTLTAGTGVSLTGTSGNVTINNTGIVTEVDGSISNEGSLTVAAGTGTTSVINSNTSGQTGVTLTAGTGLSISETGNVITLANTGIITEVDGSTSNELQTIANTSDATSHTVTLSNSGGSIQLVEGSGITLTTTGTSGAGVVTIASSGGSGDIVNGGNTTGPVIVGTNNNSATSLETNNVTRLSIASGASTGGQTTLTTVTANTTTADDALTITTSSSGTPTNGFGTGILFTAENATFSDAQLARIKPYYIDANNNSSVSALSLELSSGGSLSERFRFETTAFGTLKIGSQTPVSMTNVGIIPTAAYGINTTTANNTTIGGGTGRVFINSAQQGNGVNINVTDPTYGSVTIGQDVNGILENTSTVTQERPSLEIKQSFVTASGGNQHTSLLLSPTINQTSSAFGVVRGIRINPTLTALTTAYRSVDIGANNALAKGIYQTGALTTNNLVGNTYFGSTSAPTALVHVAAGTATVAPMILTSGTNLTTPVAGAIEWNGTNLFATQTSGPTRRTVAFTSDIGSQTIISPSQLTAAANDWNPTDLATATVIRLSGDNQFRIISGITAPSASKELTLTNVGTFAVLITKEDGASSAANRFAIDSDVPLYTNQSVILYYDLTSSRWRIKSKTFSEYSTPGKQNTSYFISTGSSTNGDYDHWLFAGSVLGVTPTSTRGRNTTFGTGASSVGSGSITTKGASIFTGTTANVPNSVIFRTSTSVTNLSDAGQTFTTECGYGVSTAIPSDGACFRYSHGINGGKWLCVTRLSSTETTTDSGVTVTADTPDLLEIYHRPDNSVAFFINGSLVAEHTTNIYNSSATPVCTILKSVGTTSRLIAVDFIQVLENRR